jgi:hypothetical protein
MSSYASYAEYSVGFRFLRAFSSRNKISITIVIIYSYRFYNSPTIKEVIHRLCWACIKAGTLCDVGLLFYFFGRHIRQPLNGHALAIGGSIESIPIWGSIHHPPSRSYLFKTEETFFLFNASPDLFLSYSRSLVQLPSTQRELKQVFSPFC